MATATLCLLGGPVAAQPWRLTPSVDASATVTDNVALADAAQARTDLVLQLLPRLQFSGAGSRLNVEGDIGLSITHHARYSQYNRVLPSGRLAAKANLVDRWLGLESSVQAQSSADDVYAARGDDGSPQNRLTTVRYELAPYLAHDFSPTLSLDGRLAHSWVRRRGDFSSTDARRDAHLEADRLRLVQRPVPLGWSIEASRESTRFDGDLSAALTTQSVRLGVSYAPVPQWSVGLLAGRESTRFALQQSNDTLYGVRLEGRPTERSAVAIDVEHHFFGTGWKFDISHRSPFVVLRLRGARQPATGVSTQTLTGGTSTASLVDALLTTRFPDPVRRAAEVRDLLSRLGLPETLNGPAEFYADTARLEQSVEASAALVGRTNAVTLSLFASELRPLQVAGATPLAGDTQSNRQTGASLDWSHRLGSLTSVQAAVRWARVQGLEARAADRADDASLSLGLNHRLSPAMTGMVSLRHLRHTTNVTGAASARENALVAGLAYRF